MLNFDDCLHDTQTLLDVYRPCVWTLSDSANDIHDKLADLCMNTLIESPAKKTAAEMFQAIIDYDVDISAKPVEKQIRSFSKTYKLILIADDALSKLHSFPVYGESYFNLLYELYFNTNLPAKPSASSVMDKLGYYDTKTFYNHRKKAIKLFNSIIWDSYASDLQELLSIIAQKAQAYGWLTENALERKKYKF